MTIKINSSNIEFITTEGISYTLKETTTGFDFSGRLFASSTTNPFQGTVAGYAAVSGNVISKFPFASDTVINTQLMLQAGLGQSGHSSSVSGYASGGVTPSATSNVIQKWPFASNSNSSDAGDLATSRSSTAGQSSSTHGYVSGGLSFPAPTVYYTDIDKFAFETGANASDIGDLTLARFASTGQNSPTHGYTTGGSTATPLAAGTARADRFPFSADANATEISDLSVFQMRAFGHSSAVSGYSIGGGFGNVNPLQPNNSRGEAFKFPFATNSPASQVSSLTPSAIERDGGLSCSSVTSGYLIAGRNDATSLNTTLKYPFATDSITYTLADITTGFPIQVDTSHFVDGGGAQD